MQFLAFGESGYRQITNNVRPITSPEDLKDLKLRVPAMNMYFDLFKCFGTNSTTMNMSEVFSALQQKIIDGQENPLDVIKAFKVNEVQKYLTIWNCSYDPIVFVANPDTWASLSTEEQEIFEKTAVEAMNYQKEYSRDQYNNILDEFKGQMEVTELTEEQIATFREAAQPVYDTWNDQIGSEMMALVNAG